ncbi:hypothetical protein C0J52_22125 [Blattella germanica]|nr:hypothetical protein C0J52_22125 [Blattella germanica]
MCNVFVFVSYGRSLIKSSSSQLGTRELVMNELGVMAVFLVLHLLMMCGIHNRKPNLMLPYLAVSLVTIFIVVLYLIAWPLYQFLTFPDLQITDIYITSIIATVIAATYWVVMYSYYRQMEQERRLGITPISLEEHHNTTRRSLPL